MHRCEQAPPAPGQACLRASAAGGPPVSCVWGKMLQNSAEQRLRRRARCLAQRAAVSSWRNCMAARARPAVGARAPRTTVRGQHRGARSTGGRVAPAVRSCGEIKAGLTRARPAGRRLAGLIEFVRPGVRAGKTAREGACEPARRQLIAGHPASGHARPCVHACWALRAPRPQCSATPVPGLRAPRGHGWPVGGSRSPRSARTVSESVRGGLSSRKLSALLVVIIATLLPDFRWEASCALTWA